MSRGENCLFRWSVGTLDTVSLTDCVPDVYRSMIWLTKLSILSFRRWFPKSDFLLLYNGYDFADFVKLFNEIEPSVDVLIIDQRNPSIHPEKFNNPYHFVPLNGGVWMKWVPFRFDIEKTEIAVDTDILCIGEPKTWYKWLDSNDVILVAPERYEQVNVSTCGDFSNHSLLKNKKPFNCGVVGQKAGHDFGKEFFEITRQVQYGKTRNSFFITEQGAINLWVRSLESKGIKYQVLDFKKNSWMRDLIYFLRQGVEVETVHAVAWYKKVVGGLSEIFERRIKDPDYDRLDFLSDILKRSKDFDVYARYVIARQLGNEQEMSKEFLLPKRSF